MWSPNSAELDPFSTGMVEASKKADIPRKENDQKLQLGNMESWKDYSPLTVVLWKWWQGQFLDLCAGEDAPCL